jgi:hypothetical protein
MFHFLFRHTHKHSGSSGRSLAWGRLIRPLGGEESEDRPLLRSINPRTGQVAAAYWSVNF